MAREKTLREFGKIIPDAYERYARDIEMVKRKHAGETVLGVGMRGSLLVAPPVLQRCYFSSRPEGTLGMGKIGRQLAVTALAEYGVLVTINKDDGSGSYAAELHYSDIEVRGDVWNSYPFKDGGLMASIVVGGSVTAKDSFGEMNDTELEDEVLDAIKKAFA